MTPRPTPDLDLRRTLVVRTARDLAEAEGWAAVTVRRLATELGVTQPVLYSAFSGRGAVVDAVALDGFRDLAAALHAADPSPLARMRVYLDVAAAHPRTYEAMFSMASELPFDADDTPEPLRRAFAGLRDVFPDADGTRAEVAWSTLHGLAALRAAGRLPADREQDRLHLAHRALTSQETP